MISLLSTPFSSDRLNRYDIYNIMSSKTQSHHSLTTIAKMSLSDLPNELIVHVFKSVDNIGSAAALSQASHHLHKVWRYNLPSICDAVLPRMIECYEQAHQLLEARAKSDLVAGEWSLSIEEKAYAAILRSSVLFTNADIVHEALKWFEGDLTAHWEDTPERFEQCACDGTGLDHHDNRTLVRFSRRRFLQGCYRALSMIYWAEKSAKRRYQLLASMSLMDYFEMLEIMEWIVFYYGAEVYLDEDRALPGYDSRPRDPGEEAGVECIDDIMEGLTFLELLEEDLSMFSGIEKPVNMMFWDPGPSYQLILHDDCLNNGIKKAESIALADILPRLPKNNSSHPGYDILTPH